MNLRPVVLYVGGLFQLLLILVYMYIIRAGSRKSTGALIAVSIYIDSHSTPSIQAAMVQSHSTPNNSPTQLQAAVVLQSHSNYQDTAVHASKDVDPNQPFDEDMKGKLNYDVWHWIVGYTVDDMRIKRCFPNQPDDRNTTDTLHIKFSEKDPNDIRGKYAHKIYGYLLPEHKGEYSFSAKMSGLTAACTVELWISSDTDPMNMHRVLTLEYPGVALWWRSIIPTARSETSSPIMLEEDYYYFEFLEKAYDGNCIVDVTWKPPNSDSFSPIPNSSFAMAASFDAGGQLLDSSIAEVLQGPLPSNALQDRHHVQFIGDTIYPITVLDVLPKCAEFAYPQSLSGITKTDVYPGDKTKFQITVTQSHLFGKVGNAVIGRNKVDEVLSMYKNALNASKKYSGEIVKLHSLERTKIKQEGFRFLLELDVKLINETVHTSEYVYLPNDGSGLCHTANFEWRKNVDVHFIVTLRNLGQWAIHLIHNMEYTQDEHFSLVIVDYDSQDIDIEEELRKSSLKRWHVIKLHGDFIKSLALQAGIDYIQDPDSIVMTLDMHLTLPTGFVEYTRRHVIQNKVGFVPMLFRLEAGYTEINLTGFYEIWGTGLFAMYKSDFDIFGGYNGMKNSTKWGGEDWKLLDRAVEKGYEAYRLRCPGLVHYYHSKAGMWDNKN